MSRSLITWFKKKPEPEPKPEPKPEFLYSMSAIWKMKELAKDFERDWLEQAIIVAKGRGSDKVEIFDVDMALSKAWHVWQMRFRQGKDY